MASEIRSESVLALEIRSHSGSRTEWGSKMRLGSRTDSDSPTGLGSPTDSVSVWK